MTLRMRIATVVGAVAAATMLTVTSASAVAIEDDLATSTTDPGNDTICTSTGSWSQACFYANGDWFGVKDDFKDDLSAVVAWEVVDASGRVVRAGNIWNNAGSDAGWRFKNKNFPEGDFISFRACRGSYPRLHIQDGSCGAERSAYV
ncbi:hypothetical protein GFH48_29400 [Streptomyces fagopyri]|uniref:Secreted protein n=1 Tax=Streptomyces fagopyri TaxID=2662397 RepID=A0A5Q0LK16_9ACTN|nr:hypothetical protein [Streptomyces fagopyri]QFZ76837.1 hypothetical protein GFH48_29400 [Streptomyces fagopyri]